MMGVVAILYTTYSPSNKIQSQSDWYNKIPMPMTQVAVDVVNQQAKQEGELDGIVFRDIDGMTILDDLEAAPGEEDPEFNDDDDDDRSYLTSDDSTMEGDHKLGEGLMPIEELYEPDIHEGGGPDTTINAQEYPGMGARDDDTLLEDLSNHD